VKSDGRIDGDTARGALEMLNVDEYGLDEMDARILRAIIENFGGGPVGLGSLAVAVGEDANTLEEVYEPYLIQNGYLHRTARGRVATPRAFERFGYALPPDAASAQAGLFGDDS
jgi:Holliday junction DNA helicase RuvB